MKYRCIVVFAALLGQFAQASDGFLLESPEWVLSPNPDQVAVDQRGRIFVPDPSNSKIRVFSQDGEHLFAFGRKGEGPGEFKRWFGEFTIGEDGRIYQVDFWGGNRFINIFDSQGTFVEIIPLRDIPGVFGPDTIFHLSDDRFLLGVQHHWQWQSRGPVHMGGSLLTFYPLDQDGNVADKVWEKRALIEVSTIENGEGRPHPGSSKILSAFSRERGLVVFQVENEQSFVLLDLASQEAVTVDNGFELKPLTDDGIDAYLAQRLVTYTMPRYREYERGVYAALKKLNDTEQQYLPAVALLFFDRKGHLYLVSPPDQQHHYQVHVFSKDNDMVDRWELALAPFHVSGDQVFLLDVDEDLDAGRIVIKDKASLR